MNYKTLPNGDTEGVSFFTTPMVQPCSPAEDGVCEALECCKQLREQNTMLDRIAAEYEETVSQQAKRIAADEALLRQALEALEYAYGCMPLPQTEPVIDAIDALRERLK
jgi:hypothetical protein